MFAKLSGAVVALALSASAVFADHVMVSDAYARSSTMMSSSGAAFMVLHNHADHDVTLIAAEADGLAERIELHTHIEDENGVMRMREVEGGMVIPAHGELHLKRGGLHIMFLGLQRSLSHGDSVDLTLVFDHGDPMDITVPVDLERQDAHGHGHMDHSHMDHGHSDHAHTEQDHGDHGHSDHSH